MGLSIVNNNSDMNTWSYISKSLSNEDILKSLSKSDLVQVQRTVTRKGATFTQIFWVKPSKVKKTDHILQGRENLHLNNAKAFKATGSKGNEDEEHYKFITAASGANSIDQSTKIEDGTSEETKGKVVKVVDKLSEYLADNIEESINQSKHIGYSDVDEWDNAYFQSTYGLSKEDYFKNHHISLPSHFHVEPHVQKITKKRIRVIYNTSLDYDKVSEGTKAMLKAAFMHEQINDVEFRNVKGKLAIRLKVSNKGMYTSGSLPGTPTAPKKSTASPSGGKPSAPSISTPVISPPTHPPENTQASTTETPPIQTINHMDSRVVSQVARDNNNLKPLTQLNNEQLQQVHKIYKSIGDFNKMFGVLDTDGKPCDKYPGIPYEYSDYHSISKQCPWYKNWYSTLSDSEKSSIRKYVLSDHTYPFNNFLNGVDHPSKFKSDYNKLTENKVKKAASSGDTYLGCSSAESYRLHCEGRYSEDDKPILKAMYEDLHNSISRAEVPEPFISFRRESRYSRYGNTDLLKKFIDAGKDGVVSIGSVWSTTPIQGSFSPSAGKMIEYKIKIPSGKGVGMWLAPKLGLKQENEFLLDSNSIFRVTSDLSNINDNDNIITVELEYLGRKDIPFDDIWEKAKANGLVREKSDRTLAEEGGKKKKSASTKNSSVLDNPYPISSVYNSGYKTTVNNHTVELKKMTHPATSKEIIALYIDGDYKGDAADMLYTAGAHQINPENIKAITKYALNNSYQIKQAFGTLVSALA